MRPIQHLNKISKKYPNGWSQINMFRTSKGDDLPDWPDWCFLPFAAWAAIVSEGRNLTMQQAGDISILAALGTWRYTQGIYRFDNELYKELIKTEINSDLPSDLFFRLKEWCVYVDTPENPDFYGFFAHLEHDIKTGAPELRLLIDYEDSLTPIILHLGDWSVEKALGKSIQTSIEIQKNQNFPSALINTTEQFSPILIESQSKIAKQCISLLLYLCSEEPDIDPVDNVYPKNPIPKKIKNSFKFFPPNKPKMWGIGNQIGKQLRDTDVLHIDNDEHSSPKAHIRRAHWHGYWLGQRGSQNKKFIYKWISPIFVNAIDKN